MFRQPAMMRNTAFRSTEVEVVAGCPRVRSEREGAALQVLTVPLARHEYRLAFIAAVPRPGTLCAEEGGERTCVQSSALAQQCVCRSDFAPGGV